jgi:uncharacterized protein (DUF433 family)
MDECTQRGTNMAITTSVDIGSLISKSPDVWHGRPVITGTKKTVMGIIAHHKSGASPEEIAHDKYLTLAQVYAALTYYYANQQEIESDIAEEQAEYDVAAKEALHAEKRA